MTKTESANVRSDWKDDINARQKQNVNRLHTIKRYMEREIFQEFAAFLKLFFDAKS